jgi:hypothetical protein
METVEHKHAYFLLLKYSADMKRWMDTGTRGRAVKHLSSTLVTSSWVHSNEQSIKPTNLVKRRQPTRTPPRVSYLGLQHPPLRGTSTWFYHVNVCSGNGTVYLMSQSFTFPYTLLHMLTFAPTFPVNGLSSVESEESCYSFCTVNVQCLRMICYAVPHNLLKSLVLIFF